MAKKVLTTNNSDCGCSGSEGGLVLQPSVDLDNLPIIVRNIDGALNGNVVREYEENGKKIYQLEDFTLVKPIVALNNNSVETEVGATIATVIFNGSITVGSYPIVGRSISPDPGGLDLTAPFTFNKLNVKRTSPGVAESHTLQATDDHGNQSIVTSEVIFKFAMYQGYSDLATLDQNQIKALVNKTLNDNILQQYGGEETYVVPGLPAVPKYIYWSGPVGTTAIAAALLEGFGLALTVLPSVNVTNPNDGTIITPHWVIRTTSKFDPGSYDITIS